MKALTLPEKVGKCISNVSCFWRKVVSGSAFIPCIIEKSCSNTLLFCCYSLFPAIRKYFPVFF